MIKITHRALRYASVLLMSALFFACQSGNPSGDGPGNQLQVTILAPTPGTGYPAPANDSPYPPGNTVPTPGESVQPDSLPTATVDTTLGQVMGTLQVGAGGDTTPVANQLLYLAELIVDTTGQERVAALDRQAAPRTFSDQDGHFQFTNVGPGRYGLILDTVIEAYLLNHPDSGESIVVTVSSNDSIDLGVLVFESLPLPQ